MRTPQCAPAIRAAAPDLLARRRAGPALLFRYPGRGQWPRAHTCSGAVDQREHAALKDPAGQQAQARRPAGVSEQRCPALPAATGWTYSCYSSTRPSRARDWTNRAPPWATISPPGSALSRAISSAVSPEAIRDSGQSADFSVLENTTFGMLFMMAATGSVDTGRVSAMDW